MSIRYTLYTETEINIAPTSDNYAVSDLLGWLSSYRKLIKTYEFRYPRLHTIDTHRELSSLTSSYFCFRKFLPPFIAPAV